VRDTLNDCDAWKAYPQHRQWFNKLALSERLGYECGPCGLAPDKTGYYCVRPVYNLSGMGVGSRREWIEQGDASKVEPGYFWCEWFEGEHLSVDYTNNGAYWFQRSAWTGHKDSRSRFIAWTRSDSQRRLPDTFFHLLDVGCINVEFIGRRIIEVHLRPSPDPDSAVLVPVWSDDPPDKLDKFLALGFTYVPSEEDADGFLPVKRKGFLTNERYDYEKLFTSGLLD
jgi:hypothetical protein